MPDTVQSRALSEFCAVVVKRHAAAWPPTEDQLAREFLAHFGIARFAFYDGLVKWCGEVGIDVSTMDLPHDLRGANFCHEANISIVLPPNGGCFISREYTLLHELRELLEGVFADLVHPTSDRATLESRADQFAACVRMQVLVESSKDFFNLASEVRNPLGRVCAYGLVSAVTAVLLLGCTSIRHLETQFEANTSFRPT